MAPFLSLASLLLLLGAGMGLLLRVGHVVPLPWLDAAQALHAHSHTLYWGWAGLALFALVLERLEVRGRAARFALWGMGSVGVLAFPVFLYSGYGRPGIVLSAASVVPFGLGTWLAFRATRNARGPDVPLLRAALAMVPLAWVAALSRVVLKVLGHGSPAVAGVAVHLFLGAFSAFFTLALAALWVRALGAGRSPHLRLLAGFAPLLPLPGLLAVPGLEGSVLDGMARAAAVGGLVSAGAWAAWSWRHGDAVLRSMAAAWGFSALLQAGSAVGLLPPAWASRHGAVLVIHLHTLGVVTTGLLALLERRSAAPRTGLVLAHQGATALMVLGLGGAALGVGTSALALAAAGGAAVLLLQAAVVLLPRTRDTAQMPKGAFRNEAG